MTLVLNGYYPEKVTTSGADARIQIRPGHRNLVDIILNTKENKDVRWEICFKKG